MTKLSEIKQLAAQDLLLAHQYAELVHEQEPFKHAVAHALASIAASLYLEAATPPVARP